MNSLPRVTVVTPTLNRRRLLERTVQSVRSQDYTRIEHIVVDGGSTDGTVDFLRNAERQYGVQWLSEPDSGLYDAVNKGMALSQGTILAYLNSDDYYFPWTVRTAVTALSLDSSADFVYGDLVRVDERSGRGYLVFYPLNELSYLRRTGFIAQPTVFWRRSAWENIGRFDDRLRYVADCDYWMRAGSAHKFVRIPEFMAVDSLSSDALRTIAKRELERELRLVRARYSTRSERSLFFVQDRLRYMIAVETAYVQFASLWLRGVRGTPPQGPWSEFRTSNPRIDLRRLLLGILPDRSRRLGRGMIMPGLPTVDD